MNQTSNMGIVEIIGEDHFKWLSGDFGKETGLRDVPDVILERICSVDVTSRNFEGDKNAITSIALITFAYRMAGTAQHPKFGSNDLLLLKVLAKGERSRRKSKKVLTHKMWKTPLYGLITGEVGERIRAKKFMTNPK